MTIAWAALGTTATDSTPVAVSGPGGAPEHDEVFRRGYHHGLHAGLEQGQDDAERNQAFDVRGSDTWLDAGAADNPAFLDRARWAEGWRAGFESGYRRAYQSFSAGTERARPQRRRERYGQGTYSDPYQRGVSVDPYETRDQGESARTDSDLGS